MRYWNKSKSLQLFDRLMSTSMSSKMKGCRRHSRGDIVTDRKEPSLCSWNRHGERARREKSERKIEWNGESGTKRQELAPFPLMILPEFAWEGRLGPVEISIRRWLPGGSLTIRFIMGDHLLVEISIALPERRHCRAMTDALPLYFPRIFIKIFSWSSHVLRGQDLWRVILCLRFRKVSSPECRSRIFCLIFYCTLDRFFEFSTIFESLII